jgi:hypothetical protein
MTSTRSALAAFVILGLVGCGGEGPQGIQGPQGVQGPAGPSGVDGIVVLSSTVPVVLNTPNLAGDPPVHVVEGTITLTEKAYLWVNADITLQTSDQNSKGVCSVHMTTATPEGTFSVEHPWEFFAPAAGYNQLDLSFDAVLAAPLDAGTYTLYAACGKDRDSATPAVQTGQATLTAMIAQSKQ